MEKVDKHPIAKPAKKPLQVQSPDGRPEQFAGVNFAEIRASLQSPGFAKIAEAMRSPGVAKITEVTRQAAEAMRAVRGLDPEKMAETRHVLQDKLFPPRQPSAPVAIKTSSTKRGHPDFWDWQGLISILKRETTSFESTADFEEWISNNVGRADGKLRGNARPQMKSVRVAIRRHGLDRIAKILKR